MHTQRLESRRGGTQGETGAPGSKPSRTKSNLRRCRECGVPFAISENHVWEEHGRILSRDSSQRLVIVETKIIDGIIRRILERLGPGMGELLMHAKAFDASHYMRSLMMGWRKLAAGYPLLKKPFYSLLCDQARVMGMADARLENYKRGRELIISCTQCYNKVFFAGDLLGGVYAGEGKASTMSVEEKGGETRFIATVQDREDFREVDKYSFNWEVPLPGYVSYRRCASCGIPFAISFFTWDHSRGLMVDTHNGEPVALINVAGLNAAYMESKNAQGDWIDEFLAREVKEMVDGILPGLEWKRRRPEEKIRDLFFLAYRGFGNPVFTEPISDGIKARVENPFNYPLVAGIAVSFLARGRPVTFEWERSMPGRLEIYMHFKEGGV